MGFKRTLILGLGLTLMLLSCHSGIDQPRQQQQFDSPDISSLRDEVFYFPLPVEPGMPPASQALRRFDLVFAGHNIDPQSTGFDKLQNIAALTPGKYTHVFAYIGKDAQGLAYGVEMNVDQRQDFRLGYNGISVDGHFYLVCLGSDFNHHSCPPGSYLYGVDSYDYMLAKRLKPELLAKLRASEQAILQTMNDDLVQAYPFQVPLDFGFKDLAAKTAYLRDDGRRNGADCASYFVSLYAEVAGICLQNVRVDAASLSDYYRQHPLGRRAVIPARYNPVTGQTVTLNAAITDMGYQLKNNRESPGACSSIDTSTGIPTPDALFNSPSLQHIALITPPRVAPGRTATR